MTQNTIVNKTRTATKIHTHNNTLWQYWMHEMWLKRNDTKHHCQQNKNSNKKAQNDQDDYGWYFLNNHQCGIIKAVVNVYSLNNEYLKVKYLTKVVKILFWSIIMEFCENERLKKCCHDIKSRRKWDIRNGMIDNNKI